MKKLFLALALTLGVASFTFANSYKLNEAAIETAFEAATELPSMAADLTNPSSMLAAKSDEVTVGGFLVRAYFCGYFGIHRSYAGTGDKKVALIYCLLSVIGGWGGYIAWIDFIIVLLQKEEGLAKYKDNPKLLVFFGD